MIKITPQQIEYKKYLLRAYERGWIRSRVHYPLSQRLRLTGRELQAVVLLACGYNTRNIAVELGLSYRTIEHFLTGAKDKFACVGQLDLVRKLQQKDVLQQICTSVRKINNQ